MQMSRVLNNHNKKIWVVLLVGGVAATTLMMALLLAQGIKPAHAGAFPGKNGKIAFETNRDGNYEVYPMDPNGANQRNLTRSNGLDGGPSYSADGKKIVFETARDGNYEIYKMNSNGLDQTDITNAPGSDEYRSSWQPLH
jgi:Tol biopolymer transport system component